MTERAVVVGGGFAALEIALALRKQRRDLPITVVSTETELIYRPWLIKVPAGGAQPPVIPFARLVAAARVELVSDRAARVDVEGKRVFLESGAEMDYGQLVVATGAVADRGRVPGARDHALFPCELTDALDFQSRISSGASRVAVVFGWERPGPGLEYAAWVAARRRGITVTAIDGDGTLERRFGSQATARIRALFERRGGRLISDGPVIAIDEGKVQVKEGAAVEADVIALASPLRGCSDWLPADLLDGRGMLRVDDSMVAATGVFGIGDVLSVPEGYRLAPALFSIRSTARPIAANVLRALDRVPLQPVLRPNAPDTVGPDLDGEALLVRDGKLVMSGRLPWLFRALIDRRYLRSRNARLQVSRGAFAERESVLRRGAQG